MSAPSDPTPAPAPANSERQFLHDLATPLTTAFFILDVVSVELKKETTPHPLAEIDEKLTKVRIALEKIKTLLQNRRQFLIEQGSKPSV